MSRRASIVLAIAVGVFALLTTAIGAASGAPPQFLVADLVMGLSFLVTGLVAAWQRPGSPAGPLLIVCTALWFLGSYAPTGQPVVATIGFAFERYYDLVLAALLLMLSTGLLGWSRILLTGLGLAMAVRSFGRLFLVDPSLFPDCTGCPPNPFAIWPSLALFEASEIVSNLAIAGLTTAIGVVAIRHVIGPGGPVVRRLRWPIVIGGAIAMAGASFHAFEYAWGTATATPLYDFGEPGNEIFAWSVFGARVLVPVCFLLAILRLRGRAGPLGPLAAELDRPDGPATVGDALRTALGDPTLRLLRPAGRRGWRDESGLEVAMPMAADGSAVTFVGPAERPLAAIVHDPALADHPELLDGVVRMLRLALENERLEAEVRDQLSEVTASRARIVSATEEERRRLERDLHDGAQQRLVAVSLALQQARTTAAAPGVPDELGSQLSAATDELTMAIRELREFARGIHPAILEEEGLGAAVAGLARRSSIPVEVDLHLDGRLPGVVESTAYFTIAEALTNCQRHARATHARVRIAHVGDRLEVEVGDDGAGGADSGRGTGLRGLADRITAIGGEMVVDSPPDGGTIVRAALPVR